MRSRRPTPVHQEAVARRLALLTAELEGVRREAGGSAPSSFDGLRSPDEYEPSVPSAPAEQPAPPPASAFPVPGRHSARRDPVPDEPDEGVPGWWQRLPLGPAHLTVVAVLVAAAIAITAWQVVSAHPEQVGPVASDTTASGSTRLVSEDVPGEELPAGGASPGATPSAAASSGTTVTVDVEGKVRRPGIAVLPVGSRVVDALAEVGGAMKGVDLAGLNLARVLVDGEQIVVGAPAPVAGAAPSAAGAPSVPAALVNLNTADQATLETLPGIGPVTAQAILAWRQEHGSFTSVDELLEVSGIGEATLADVSPLVTV
ncbi:ComEA family DNA-binding protein [Nocardioides acrostichi]|uniref:ComEA family DNA-binding protein n=1 Tax=Nocardioides acrostichi TaxID=2784339 RepID=A0A930UYP6_9ACTN|nr:ComEA family DNA-binding protein [Nocardioides acrostichi]MBF4163323.1 ComEA family DNA-binding protein [Nocardioides acrostichi]